MIQVVALADPGEHRIAAVRLGDVVDQFHDDDGLADPGAAEQADLAALGVRRQQIDDLDPGDEDLGLGRLLDEFGRGPVDRHAAVGVDRTALIDRLADHIENPAERLGADRHHDREAGIDDLGAAHQPVGGVHRDRAHGALAEMLGHFEHQGAPGIIDLERGQNRRQFALEADIDDRADDLGDRADIVSCHVLKVPCGYGCL